MSKSEERALVPEPVDISAQIAEAVSAAVSAERDRCAGLVAAFGGLALDFCAEHIRQGTDQTAAKAAAFDAGIGARASVAPAPVETPAASAPVPDAETPHSGAAPIPTAEPRGMTMQERVSALRAQESGLSFEGACARIAKSDPDYYAAYTRGECA